MICVYPADCTDFSNNGLGAVSPTSCTVTETLNGEWELTLVHPIDERDKWRKLTDGGILRVPVPAAMTPQINLVTQQYQTTTYDVEVYKVSTSRDPLRLRSGTGTKYKILGKYKKGTEVIVIEKTSSSWYEVTCPDGKHGYMSSEYLTYVRTEQQSTTPMWVSAMMWSNHASYAISPSASIVLCLNWIRSLCMPGISSMICWTT